MNTQTSNHLTISVTGTVITVSITGTTRLIYFRGRTVEHALFRANVIEATAREVEDAGYTPIQTLVHVKDSFAYD